MRAHLSKRIVAKMARKRREERTEDARAWTETWSEDAQAWFYYNPQTGQLQFEWYHVAVRVVLDIIFHGRSYLTRGAK